MSRNPGCTIFIGNLDEKVDERVLYEILIQVGRVVDLHIPRDKETNRHRGIGFAEYESEQIADYAVRLFSGLVRLHNKILRFAIAGQDKASQNTGTGTPVTPKLNCPLPPNAPSPRPVHGWDSQLSQNAGSVGNFRVPSGNYSASPVHPQVQNAGSEGNFGVLSGNYSASPILPQVQNAGSVGNFRVPSGNYSASPVHPQVQNAGSVGNFRVPSGNYSASPFLPQVQNAGSVGNFRIPSGNYSTSPVHPQVQNAGSVGNLRVPSGNYSASPVLPQVHNAGSVGNLRVSSGNYYASPVHPQAYRGGLVNNGLNNSNYEYNRRVFGAVVNGASRPAVRQPIAYPSY